MTQDYDEKRSFHRMQIESDLRFTYKGQDNPVYKGVSQDLSATGLLMYSDIAPEIGTEISVVMDTDNDRLPAFIAEGKVVRVKADTEQAGRYLISLELHKTQ